MKYNAKQKRGFKTVFIGVLMVILAPALLKLVAKASPTIASKVEDLQQKTDELISNTKA